MFVGHLALALAGKRAAPTVSLGWLMAAVTALDIVWPPLLPSGLEHVRIVPGATAFTPLVFDSYPWSHSLLMAFAWGLVLAAVAHRPWAVWIDRYYATVGGGSPVVAPVPRLLRYVFLVCISLH